MIRQILCFNLLLSSILSKPWLFLDTVNCFAIYGKSTMFDNITKQMEKRIVTDIMSVMP